MIAILASITVLFSPLGGCEAKIVKEINNAKQQVLVQAYAFTSWPIASALITDKQRGVDVKVILDRSYKNQAAKVEAELVKDGIPVLIDNKHTIAHNKIVEIDGRIVLTGSYNFTWTAEHSNAENLTVIRDKKIAAQYITNWQMHAAHSLPP